MKEFDFYYNQTIARTIECQTIYEISNLSEETAKELIIEKDTLWKIATLSWNEFKEIYEKMTEASGLENRYTLLKEHVSSRYLDKRKIPQKGPWNYHNTESVNDCVCSNDLHFINADGEDTNTMFVYTSANNNYTLKYKLVLKESCSSK